MKQNLTIKVPFGVEAFQELDEIKYKCRFCRTPYPSASEAKICFDKDAHNFISKMDKASKFSGDMEVFLSQWLFLVSEVKLTNVSLKLMDPLPSDLSEPFRLWIVPEDKSWRCRADLIWIPTEIGWQLMYEPTRYGDFELSNILSGLPIDHIGFSKAVAYVNITSLG